MDYNNSQDNNTGSYTSNAGQPYNYESQQYQQPQHAAYEQLHNEQDQNYQQDGQYFQQPQQQNNNKPKPKGVLGKVALGLAIASNVCCCFPWIFEIAAIVCGIIAIVQANKNNETDKCALAALILAGISIVLNVGLLISSTKLNYDTFKPYLDEIMNNQL